MISNLLDFLGTDPETYPYSYPTTDMIETANKYYEQQHGRIILKSGIKQFTFGWEIDSEEEALAFLINIDILYRTGNLEILGKWLRTQSYRVLDLADEYFRFSGFSVEY